MKFFSKNGQEIEVNTLAEMNRAIANESADIVPMTPSEAAKTVEVKMGDIPSWAKPGAPLVAVATKAEANTINIEMNEGLQPLVKSEFKKTSDAIVANALPLAEFDETDDLSNYNLDPNDPVVVEKERRRKTTIINAKSYSYAVKHIKYALEYLDMLPASRERSCVATKLDEAIMWIRKAPLV